MKLVLGITLALATGLAAQLPLPPFSSTYSQPQTRGYFFQAPVDFEVTGAQVPDETNKGNQVVAFYRMTAAPPAYTASRSENAVFYASATSDKVISINPSLKYKKGEWFGVLGACGPTSGTLANSYGAGMYNSSILGTPVVLARFIMQANIGTNSGNGAVSAAGTSSIARVRVYVKGGGSAVNYGMGTGLGSIPAGALAHSDPSPPILGKTAALVLTPGTTSNTNAVLVIGNRRSTVNVGFGTLLAYPFFYVQGVSGPIASTGTTISFPIPNNAKLLGVQANFQAAVGVTGGFTLTNGMEWVAGN